jgi:Ran GTPase-activating protein (RanGAP) involved in mRNA processing and transport
LLDSEISLELLFVGNNNIDDDGALLLVKSLVPCTSLKVLDMKNNVSISATGWRAFFRSLMNARSSAEGLFLDGNNIDDEGAAMLIRLLAKTRKIDTLTLRGNDLITFDGWRGFARSLLSTTLKVIRLGTSGYRTRFNSNYVRRFGKALELTKNTTLEVLNLFNDDEDPEIHPRAWEAFNKVLCNNSSISDIVSSNHTLYEIVEIRYGVPQYLQFDLKTESLLQINRHENKAEVVRTKILKYFFSGSANISTTFVDICTTMMPNVIEWIGRDYSGFSVMYELFRSMTWLLF